MVDIRAVLTRENIPIALAASTFLDRCTICVDMASLSKVAREPLFTLGSAISNAGVVTVSELVRTGHCLASVLELRRQQRHNWGP
jgi:hypothetical protein